MAALYMGMSRSSCAWTLGTGGRQGQSGYRLRGSQLIGAVQGEIGAWRAFASGPGFSWGLQGSPRGQTAVRGLCSWPGGGLGLRRVE